MFFADEIPAHKLNYCGAPGIEFMDQDCVSYPQFPLQEYYAKHYVEVVNRRPIEAAHETQFSQFQ